MLEVALCLPALAGLMVSGQGPTTLLAPDGEALDIFGWSLASQGYFTVIGAPYDDDLGSESGSAYIFGLTNEGGWEVAQKLLPSDGSSDSEFGWSVAISASTVVVGAWREDHLCPSLWSCNAGAAYVFERDPSSGHWLQTQKLIAPDAEQLDVFGHSVAIDGSTIAIGAFGDDDNGSQSGAVYVFERGTRAEGLWSPVQKLTAVDGEAGDQYGISVSVRGDLIVVGADGEDDGGTGSGAAYVLRRGPNGIWKEAARLKAPVVESGAFFGKSVSVWEETVLVGAHGGHGKTGAAHIYHQSGSAGAEQWKHAAELLAIDGALGDGFGYSVDLHEGIALVGAWHATGVSQKTGAAYVFVLDGAGYHWSQGRKLVDPHGAPADWFGISCAIGRTSLLLGSYLDTNKNGSDAGSVIAFDRASSLDQ